jgi:hypothetical protein
MEGFCILADDLETKRYNLVKCYKPPLNTTKWSKIVKNKQRRDALNLSTFLENNWNNFDRAQLPMLS